MCRLCGPVEGGLRLRFQRQPRVLGARLTGVCWSPCGRGAVCALPVELQVASVEPAAFKHLHGYFTALGVGYSQGSIMSTLVQYVRACSEPFIAIFEARLSSPSWYVVVVPFFHSGTHFTARGARLRQGVLKAYNRGRHFLFRSWRSSLPSEHPSEL